MLETLLFWILPVVCWFLPSYTIGRAGARVYNRRYTLVPNHLVIRRNKDKTPRWAIPVASLFGKDAIYLHHFQSSDPTTHLHNHPYGPSWSIILAGGYFETRQRFGGRGFGAYAIYNFDRALVPGMRNPITPDVYHRIDLIDTARGCWTLFVAGAKHNKGWGFLDVETGRYTAWSGRAPGEIYEGGSR